MTYLQIVILAIVQGLAELLPVSSSAHVIAAAKLMHLNASDPRFTLLLVMLHTGTMFAVIAYFWSAWKRAFFSSRYAFNKFAVQVVIATGITGIIGLVLKHFIEHYLQRHAIGKAEIEDLFEPGQRMVDRSILLGKQAKLPCRIVVWRVPQEVANRRRQKR